jgi:hypothetical protein
MIFWAFSSMSKRYDASCLIRAMTSSAEASFQMNGTLLAVVGTQSENFIDRGHSALLNPFQFSKTTGRRAGGRTNRVATPEASGVR